LIPHICLFYFNKPDLINVISSRCLPSFGCHVLDSVDLLPSLARTMVKSFTTQQASLSSLKQSRRSKHVSTLPVHFTSTVLALEDKVENYFSPFYHTSCMSFSRNATVAAVETLAF